MVLKICETLVCDNDAKYRDQMDNEICSDCMEREVSDGDAAYQNFESI